MKIILVLILTLFFLVSCGLLEITPPHIQQAGRISHIFLSEIKKKYPHYQPYGLGGAFHNTVNGFIIDFGTNTAISEEQAMADITDMYQTLNEIIDQDEGIRPYLSEWPFEGKLSDIGIFFFDPQTGRFRKYPDLAIIHYKHGKIYKTYFYPPTDRLMTLEQIEEYEVKECPEEKK